mmetsp:Transcript_7236/g.14019  ORF Transcript_7236/g.14019 Transcript_7236/m.14019 type:complete len:155 (-) Transcript_7236:102-566(-)
MLRASSLLLACLTAVSAFNAPVAFNAMGSKGALSATSLASKPLVAAAPASGRSFALDALQMSCTKDTRGYQMPMRKQCMLLKKRANNAMSVSFSHIRTHKTQEVNLQWKRIFWPEGNCYVKLRISTKAIKTLKTKPLNALAAKAGLDLKKHRCG